MDANKLKNILEAGLLVAGRTLSLAQLEALFQHDDEKPERKQIREVLEVLKEEYSGRGIELVEVASGYRLQSHASVSDWVANLFQEKTPRYSRALLETLVLIAYRQPITRAEIEEVRGVAVSSNIIKTLQERQWVKVLGHKEVPGRPALLGTTKDFLDYFNLKKLDELPSLADIKDLDQFDELLAEEIGEVDEQGDAANDDGDESGGDDAGVDTGSAGKTNGVSAGLAASSGFQQNSTEVNPDSASVQGLDSVDLDGADGNASSGDNTSDSENLSGGDSDANPDMNANSDENAPLDDNANPDESPDAHLKAGDDAGADDSLGADSNSSNDEDSSESEFIDSDDEEGAPEHNETLSGPELELLRVISDFSDEHQLEVDARDEVEAGIISKEGDIDDADVSDLSQRIGDDPKSGDMPEPGDTLH